MKLDPTTKPQHPRRMCVSPDSLDKDSINPISRRDFLTSTVAAGLVNLIPWRATGQVFGDLTDQSEGEMEWPPHVEDFPALTCDRSGNVFMATLERPMPERFIRVYRIKNLLRQQVCTLQPENLTGIAPPAIAALDNGCVVVFPVEQQDRWSIAYAFLDDTAQNAPSCRYINSAAVVSQVCHTPARAGVTSYIGTTDDCSPDTIDSGTTNILPAVAVVGSRACVVWESNAGNSRGIDACWIDQSGPGDVQRISSEGANSYNPTLVALENGSLFAAWDTVRNGAPDIYGAWYSDGSWQAEQRLTSDPRIERHPSLAVWENQVWMTWQAQSFFGTKLNGATEQRIVVARIDDGSLLAPTELFQQVSTPERFLMRPRIAFDPSGWLWLTARRCVGVHGGWHPVVWNYGGNGWSEQEILFEQQGRWRPVTVGCTSTGSIAACQCDDIPPVHVQRGVRPDWKSAVVLTALPETEEAPVLETVPLVMPKTDFSLPEVIQLNSAKLPRQQTDHNGQELTLFWGDLHDHTDLSQCVRKTNPPGHDLFANVRDIEMLDFCALTDHGFNFDPPQWAYNGEQTRNNHDPGRFVTFLGQEWTSSENPPAFPGLPHRYGHRNLIFLDPYFGQFYDAYDEDISPADLWTQLDGTEFICIPHQLADWKYEGTSNPPTDWNFVDENLQPVAEIWQIRRSYEYLGCPKQADNSTPFKGYFLQDAWAKGIIIGVIASPDHGGGNGKVGVWANGLTRESIFGAIRARHTFGTSGAKMALWFSAGTAMMGDKVEHPPETIHFQVKALAMRKINRLAIFRNNEIVHLAQPGTKEFDLHWTDENPPQGETLWYYTRIKAEDGSFAWSSPIWFVEPNPNKPNLLFVPLLSK